MPFDRIRTALLQELETLDREGRRKGAETVVTGIVPAEGKRGPRVQLAGEGDRLFLRMNSNGYLSMALREEVQRADEEATRRFGAGPQAVRFIGGTFEPHIELERRLAAFHGREAGMIFSSAYATVMGVLPPLLTAGSAVVSDALNHNCIINAIRLSRASGDVGRFVYDHGDVAQLEQQLVKAAESGARRAIVVTDGVFSMRGDVAPLREIVSCAEGYDARFPENAIVVVDDSHGVGVLGATGRGSEEEEGARADVLVGTLGKAFGVNGGYVVGDSALIDHLREVSPYYVYSNPITCGEAAAAARAIQLLDSDDGRKLLAHLHAMTARFEHGLTALAYETISSPHPVVPLLLRGSERTTALVRHLYENEILATGLGYPVVPRGAEEIRFQLCADHTPADIDEVLAAIGSFELD